MLAARGSLCERSQLAWQAVRLMGMVFRNLTLSFHLVPSLAFIVVQIRLLHYLIALATPRAAEKQCAPSGHLAVEG